MLSVELPETYPQTQLQFSSVSPLKPADMIGNSRVEYHQKNTEVKIWGVKSRSKVAVLGQTEVLLSNTSLRKDLSSFKKHQMR